MIADIEKKMEELRSKLDQAESHMLEMDLDTRERYREALHDLAASIESMARGDAMASAIGFLRALPVMVECERRLVRQRKDREDADER
jgi:hypothetical protein